MPKVVEAQIRPPNGYSGSLKRTLQRVPCQLLSAPPAKDECLCHLSDVDITPLSGTSEGVTLGVCSHVRDFHNSVVTEVFAQRDELLCQMRVLSSDVVDPSVSTQTRRRRHVSDWISNLSNALANSGWPRTARWRITNFGLVLDSR